MPKRRRKKKPPPDPDVNFEFAYLYRGFGYAPHVMIVEADPGKRTICGVLDGGLDLWSEFPTCKHKSGFSWLDSQWEPGPFAKQLLDVMNEHLRIV